MWSVLLKTLVSVVSSLNHTLCHFFPVSVPSLASFWMHLTLYSSPSCLFSLPLFSLLSSLFTPPHLAFSSFSCSFVPSLQRPPSPSSAHVDMSTVAFDVDPLDLEAEEAPESQGDPRSSKSMSGSVTSPQANIHRLPFFKKVTLEGQVISLLLRPAFAPLSSKISRFKLSFFHSTSLTNLS